jgi:hypothetical protein
VWEQMDRCVSVLGGHGDSSGVGNHFLGRLARSRHNGTRKACQRVYAFRELHARGEVDKL